MSSFRFVINVDVEEETLEKAYRKLNKDMTNQSWESSDEWYDETGELGDPDILQKSVMLDQPDKRRTAGMTLKMQKDLNEFIGAYDNPDSDNISTDPPSWPSPKAKKLCRALIEEESKELLESIDEKSISSVIKEGIDVLYVVFFMFNKIGIDVTPFWDAVHKNNMSKFPGPIDPITGKILKPEGYVPVDIDGILRDLY